MQLVRIVYVDGSIRDIELPYIPFEHDGRAVYSETILELRYLNDRGLFLGRRYFDSDGSRTDAMNDNPTYGGNLIIEKEEFPEIEYVKVDGEVILETDDKGGLVRPEEKLAASTKANLNDAADANFESWSDE